MGITKNIAVLSLIAAMLGWASAGAQELNLIHVAKKQETLYGISKHYSISLNDLISRNPFLQERGLQIGDTLQISMALLEGRGAVSAANTEEPSTPASSEFIQESGHRDAIPQDSFSPNSDSPVHPAISLKHDDTNALRIALILPLFEEHHDTLFMAENPEWPAQVDRRSWAGLEYLSAFEFGLRSMARPHPDSISTPTDTSKPAEEFHNSEPDSTEESIEDKGRRRFWEAWNTEVANSDSISEFVGAPGELHHETVPHAKTEKRVVLEVIDGARDTSLIRAIASTGMLNGFDAVVGPLYSDCMESLARDPKWSASKNGLWINPLSSNAQLNRIKGLSHFVPRTEVLDNLMLHYIDVMALSGRPLTVFYHPDITSAETASANPIRNRLSSYENVKWIPIKSQTYEASLETYKSGENHLVIWSDDRAFTTDLITKLNALRSEKLFIYCRAALADMGVQVVYLNNLHATYPVRSFLESTSANYWTPIYAEETGMPLTPLAMHAIDLARTLVDSTASPLFYPRNWTCINAFECENRAGVVVQLQDYTEIPVHIQSATMRPKAVPITSPD